MINDAPPAFRHRMPIIRALLLGSLMISMTTGFPFLGDSPSLAAWGQPGAISQPKTRISRKAKKQTKSKTGSNLITVKKAYEQLRQMKQAIVSRQQAMDDKYNPVASRLTLLEAFNTLEVNAFGQGYSQDWGENDIAPTWELIKPFYTTHIRQLELSAAALKGKHFTSPRDMAYLKGGLKAFNQVEEQLQALFAQEIDLMAHKAKVLGNLDEVYRQKVDLDNQLSALSTRRYKQAQRKLDPELKRLNQERDRLMKEAQDWGTQINTVDQSLRDYALKQVFSSTLAKPRIPLPAKPN